MVRVVEATDTRLVIREWDPNARSVVLVLLAFAAAGGVFFAPYGAPAVLAEVAVLSGAALGVAWVGQPVTLTFDGAAARLAIRSHGVRGVGARRVERRLDEIRGVAVQSGYRRGVTRYRVVLDCAPGTPVLLTRWIPGPAREAGLDAIERAVRQFLRQRGRPHRGARARE